MQKLSVRQLKNLLENVYWATTKDIQLIGQCGKNSALKVMKELRAEAEAENYKLPNNKIDMPRVLKYYDIKQNYIQEISLLSNKE